MEIKRIKFYDKTSRKSVQVTRYLYPKDVSEICAEDCWIQFQTKLAYYSTRGITDPTCRICKVEYDVTAYKDVKYFIITTRSWRFEFYFISK